MSFAPVWKGGAIERIQAAHDAHVAILLSSSKETLGEARAAGARAARDAAPSLEEGTLNYFDTSDHRLLEGSQGDQADNGVWKISSRFYSSGVCEVRGFLGSLSTRRPEKSSSESSEAEPSVSVEAPTEQRFESSIRRSRRILRSRCLELDADHLLTLTKRGKFGSIDQAWRAWGKFSGLMGKFYGEKWRYVVVPELHADGETYHLHVAIRGFYWAGIVRKLWQKSLGGTGYEHGESSLGNVDLKSFRRVRGVAGTRRIAGYISKYVGKGFAACNRSRRLFASSSGLHPYRIERRVCRYWVDNRELVHSIAGGLIGDGSSGTGTCYFWSRNKASGELVSKGFVLTTDWRGVA